MYVRFIVPARERRRRGLTDGMFVGSRRYTRDSRVHVGLREAIGFELDWFKANLPVPKPCAFLVKSRGLWLADGVCWFHDDAHEMIARAFALAALLGECGVPVTKIVTRAPGQILYRDDFQIVARPDDGSAGGRGTRFLNSKDGG